MFHVIFHLFFVAFVNGLETDSPDICISRRKIFVSGNATAKCDVTENVVFCNTLDDVFTDSDVNISKSCVFVANNQTLHNIVYFKNVKNVAVIGNGAFIDCGVTYEKLRQGDGSGFQIENSTNMHFLNINFMNCGNKNYSDVCAEYEYDITVCAAFHISYSGNVSFENVSILQSFGYGIYVREISTKFLLSEFTVKDNYLLPFYHNGINLDGFASGGGINMLLHDDQFSSDLLIKISASKFQNNSADLLDHSQLCRSNFSFPFGRGGGFSLSLDGFVNKVKVLIGQLTIFQSNKALWGGAINFKTANASENLMIVDTVTIYDNFANLSGGGLFVMAIDLNQGNIVDIKNTKLKKNTAMCGGGIGLYGANAKAFSKMTNVHITKNSAFLGSGIFLRYSTIKLLNVNLVKNNRNWKKAAVARGALAAFHSTVHCYGDATNITHNNNTAILLDQSALHVIGKLSITNNSGQDGGGLAIYGNSQIIPYKNSLILFKFNYATNRGGGIYVNIPGPFVKPTKSFKLNRYKCFIDDRLLDFSLSPPAFKFSFEYNKAHFYQGDSIFADTLQFCRNKDTYLLKKIFTSWSRYYTFSPNNRHHVVTSAENITLKPEQWKPIPGFLFSPSIELLDERGTQVFQGVHVIPLPIKNAEFNVSIVGNNNAFIVKTNSIQLAFNGFQESIFDADIIVDNSEVLPQMISNITMQECKFGFKMKKDTCVCNDDVNSRFKIQCVGKDLYISIYNWILNEQAKSSILCPIGYCKNCKEDETLTGFECLLNLTQQCAKFRNQSSFLCSRCLPNYSVPIGSNDCKICKQSNSGTVLLVGSVYALFILLLEIFVLFLNRITYQNFIPSMIFFYKCSSSIIFSLADTTPSQNIQLVFGNYAVSFPFSDIGLCISENLNNLTKFFWLYLMAGVYPVTLFILYVIVKLNNICSSCLMRLFSLDGFWRVFSTFIILFWYDIIHQSMTVLQRVEINDTYRVYVFADEVWKGEIHYHYYVTAVLLLTCCSAFWLLIGFSARSSSQVIFRKYCLRVSQMFDTFKIGLVINEDWKEDRSLYTLFYIPVFTSVIAMSLFISPVVRATSLSLFFLCATIVVLLVKPFEKSFMNIYEVFIFSMLSLLCLLKDSMLGLYCPQDVYHKKQSGPCMDIPNLIVAITLAPSIVILLYFIVMSPWTRVCREKCIQKYRERWPERRGSYDGEEIYFPYRAVESSSDSENE